MHQARGRLSDHAEAFRHLEGFADAAFEYVYEDGIHGISFAGLIAGVLKGKIPVRSFLWRFITKIRFRMTRVGPMADFKRAFREAQKAGPFDLILCSLTADNLHCLGDYAHRVTGVPVIYDLRDVIEQAVDADVLCHFSWRRALAVRARNLRRGAAVIVTKKEHGEALVRSGCVPNYCLIHNGYDPDVFSPLTPRMSETFDLAYVGSIYPRLSKTQFGALVSALSRFLADKGRDAPIRVRFYVSECVYSSQVLPILDKTVAAYFHKEPECDQTELPYAYAGTSVLLTVGHGLMGGISTKTFEYLASNRPILEVTAGEWSEEEQILAESRAAKVLSTESEICDYLETLYAEWRANGFVKGTADMAYVERFSRAGLASDVLAIMNRACLDVRG